MHPNLAISIIHPNLTLRITHPRCKHPHPKLRHFPTPQEPVDTLQMLRKELRGTEASTFNFGANLWTLHYLRLTNQLDYTNTQEVFDQLNVHLAAIMYRFSPQGAFKNWDTAGPSVW